MPVPSHRRLFPPAELGRELSLEVVDNRGAAVHLYRRAGWLEVGRTPIEWGGGHASELVRFAAPGPNSSVVTDCDQEAGCDHELPLCNES